MSAGVQGIFDLVEKTVQLNRSSGFAVDPMVAQARIAEHLARYGHELREETRFALMGSMVAIRMMHLDPDMVATRADENQGH